jgi:hypothetical protein
MCVCQCVRALGIIITWVLRAARPSLHALQCTVLRMAACRRRGARVLVALRCSMNLLTVAHAEMRPSGFKPLSLATALRRWCVTRASSKLPPADGPAVCSHAQSEQGALLCMGKAMGNGRIWCILTDVKGRLGSLFHLPLVSGGRTVLGRGRAEKVSECKGIRQSD